jgi:hypothetical protein
MRSQSRCPPTQSPTSHSSKQLVRNAVRTFCAYVNILHADDEETNDAAYGLREDRCPLFTCSLARLSGAAPEHCTHSSKSCEELSCYKYTHQGTCISTDAGERVHVCQRSERKVPGCAMPVGSATREWSRKECPGMMCAHALDWGYSPIYCTSTDEDVNLCPELGCHQYQPAGELS